MIKPRAMEHATTAAVSLLTVCLSGQMTLLNSTFIPLKNPFIFEVFSLLAVSAIFSRPLLNLITSFLCAKYVSCRICNTSWFPFCQDESSYPLSCYNYVVCIPYMPV